MSAQAAKQGRQYGPDRRSGRGGRAPARAVSAVTDRGIASSVLLALVAIGYSGFAGLSLETLWSRVLAFFLGNTVYGFTVVLTTVLIGIGVGSLVAKRGIRRASDPLRLLGLGQLGIGLSTLAVIPVLSKLNDVHSGMVGLAGGLGWWQVTVAKFAVAFVALLLPTVGMGASFACAVEVGARAGKSVGRLVGDVYTVNGLSGAAGSVITGFGLAPLLGTQKAIALIALLSMGLGTCLLVLRTSSRRRRVLEVGGVVVVAIALLAVARVERPMITVAGLAQGFAPPYRLVDYREGADAIVAVLEDAVGVRELSINGVSTAFTSSWDLRIHKLLAHLPMVLHPRPERVLVVGYGMGVTARSCLRHPTLKEIDVAEISSEVMEVSPRFAAVNEGTLDDPRLRLILNDGKNHLMATDRRYDVISVNAIHPGVAAGNGALYTVDFYQSARDHLTGEGVVCQWMPIHQLSPSDVRTLVQSFRVVFPHTSIWFTSNFALLIGTPRPLSLDLDQLSARLAEPSVAQDLAELGDLAIGSGTDLVGYFLMDEKAVGRYVGDAALNTDDRPIVEFSAPRSAFSSEETNLANLRLLREYGEPGSAPVAAGSQQLREALARVSAANAEVLAGQIEAYAGRPDQARTHYLRALAKDPDNVDARYLAKRSALREGVDAFHQSDFDAAAGAFMRALELAPDYAEAWYRLAVTMAELGYGEEALAYLERAVELNPDNARWRMDLAGVYASQGRIEMALEQLQRAVAMDPDYGEARVRLAMLYRKLGRTAEAEAELAEAVRLERRLGPGKW